MTSTGRRPLKWYDARRSGGSTGRLASIDCYRWPGIRPSVLCYPILLHGTPPHSHSIVLRHGNALICPRKFFPPATKNRLRDPSEICAIDFKNEFRRSAICLVSAAIGIDWPICDLRSDRPPSAPRQKTPSPGASLGSWQGRKPAIGERAMSAGLRLSAPSAWRLGVLLGSDTFGSIR